MLWLHYWDDEYHVSCLMMIQSVQSGTMEVNLGSGAIRASMLVQALAVLFFGYVCANNSVPFKYFIAAGIVELLSPCLRN